MKPKTEPKIKEKKEARFNVRQRIHKRKNNNNNNNNNAAKKKKVLTLNLL